jgi:hypothetical protein
VPGNPLPGDFQVYPNPATDKLFIHYKSNESLRLRFVNIFGEDVYEAVINGSSTVNVSMLKKGMYYLEITSADNEWSLRKKIIIY